MAARTVVERDEHPYPYDDEALTPAEDNDVVAAAAVDASSVDASGEHCPQCGSAVRSDDVFCGECGFVVHSRSSAGRDTAIVEPVDLAAPVDPWLPVQAEPDAADAADADVLDQPDEPGEWDEPEEPARPESVPARASTGFLFDDDADHEHTRIVPRREQGERFILQFSTGESITVFGSGLLGRNPVAEPGEFFDQLVAISDPGKSVSKTHLEFGQDGGAFWVSDRFSGNGSVVREPDVAPRRCEPGKRYRMVRGSRVDIGEQFFVVS